MLQRTTNFIFAVFFGALLFQGCVIQKNPISGDNRAYGYSWEEEVELGTKSDKQIVAQYGLLNDDRVAAYVDSLGQVMLQNSHLRRDDTPSNYKNTPFTFRVLNTTVVNAFALPGGFVYITRGLLNHLNNEAQLAVVLGHEIGHVAARHASQQALEQKLGQVALAGGAIIGSQYGLDPQNIMQLGGQAAQLLFLSYSRDDERESDRVGVEYAAMAGYEAEEAAYFFESLKRISKQHGGGVPTFQSSHPDPGKRFESMFDLAKKWEERGYQQTKVKTRHYMNTINGLVYGQNPREGFTRDNTFYHPELAFTFQTPAGWNVQNQPSQVVLFNADQNAIIQFSLAGTTDETSPMQAVTDFLNQEGIQVIERGEMRVNGLPAYSGTAQAKTQQQELWLSLTAIEKEGQVYLFTSYTALNLRDTYQPILVETATSFQPLTDESILSIRPPRTTLFTVKNGQTFESFVREKLGEKADNYNLKSLAIVNQVKTDEELQSGRIVKLPIVE